MAIRSRSWRRTCRRCWRRISPCRCWVPCSTPSTRGLTRRRSASSWRMARRASCSWMRSSRRWRRRRSPAWTHRRPWCGSMMPMWRSPGSPIAWNTRRCWRRAIPPSTLPARVTSGMRSRQLYVGHHGRPQGCRRASSRRLHQRLACLATASHPGGGVSLDAADVPLQWLGDTWAMTARAARMSASAMSKPALIFRDRCARVTHLSGAPIVLDVAAGRRPAGGRAPHPVLMTGGGAAPPAAMLERMQSLGFTIIHAYGLTETYGPAAACIWQSSGTRSRWTRRRSGSAGRACRIR